MKRHVDVITMSKPCPRCWSEDLLCARVPHGWTNASGGAVEGCAEVVLCAACDAEVPGAAALITWFHVHGHVEGSEEFVRLLVAWAEQVSVPPLDEQRLEAEIELWRNGEL